MEDPTGAPEGRVAARRCWRVVIADDSSEMRALLSHTLDVDRRFEIVAGTGTALETLAVIEAQLPDVVVVDPSLAGEGADSLVPAILRASPASKVVVLMGYDSRLSSGEAMASGAHAFLEKGVPHSELLAVLASLCPDSVPQRSSAAAPREAPTTDVVAAEHGAYDTGVIHAEFSMRRARWAAAAFALLQFSLYQPPDGVTTPFPLVPVGLVVAAIAVAVNLAAGAATKRADVAKVWRIGVIELGFDTALALGVVWAFTFDRTSALWALLVIPIIEGALRLQLRGAWTTWGACALSYLAREWWGHVVYGHPFEIESVTYRVGILALVAVTVGQLAQRLTQQVDVAQAARRDATRRAGLLAVVASSSRRIVSLGAGDVVPLVVSSAIDLGFDTALVCVFDETARTWSIRSEHGMPESDNVHGIDAGLAGLVHQRRETVVIEDYSSWNGALDAGISLGLHCVAGVPIWSAGELRGTLLAGRRNSEGIGPSEIESLELLATQAGVAFGNVRLLEQIRHQALHDALTGLPNQSLFEDRVNQAIARAARDKMQSAVLFIDLDRFKKVNDTLGHEAGNELLKQAGGRLLTAVRLSDTVARMGGDEFTVLLTGLATTADALASADRILEQFRKPFVLGGLELIVTPSIGIAVHPEHGAYDQLLRHSDIAMYRAKQRGGNTFELHAADVSETNVSPLRAQSG
ncbi:MAG TPA: diguanylate cyclase [Acidimicrobiales bacterium]|nr:diguanylate cyclase [Acidimicrobiales bacterium]